MREQINNNPMVQMGLLGVLALIGIVYFLMMGGEEEPAADAAATPTAGAAAAPGSATAPGTAAAPAPGSEATPAPEAGAEPQVAKLVPGPGLPKGVVEAYADGDVVAILFYNKSSFDDRRLKRTVEKVVAGDRKVTLFVEQPKQVARYSQIAQSVALDRTPALITIKPRSTTEGQPVADVHYGFRGAGSAKQAIRDAIYAGGTIAAYP